MGTHPRELSQAIDKTRPDLVILRETRAGVRQPIQNIWPGAKVKQVLPQSKTGRTNRAGIAFIMRTGAEIVTSGRWEVRGKGCKELIKAVVVKINIHIRVAGVSVSPQTSEDMLEKTLESIKGEGAQDDNGRTF